MPAAVTSLLPPTIRRSKTLREPIAVIVARVADVFELSADAILGAERGDRQVSFARQVAMYLAHTLRGLSYEQVGRRFGRDRTTVRYGVQRIETLREDIRIERLLVALEVSLADLSVARGSAS